MIRKHEVVDDFFDVIDSEEKAYLLGFFIADGHFNLGSRCTKSYRFQVALQDTDEEVVKLFQKYICPTAFLERRHCTKGAKDRKPVVTIR